MDLVRNDLLEKGLERSKEDGFQRVERLPKSEGAGSRSLRPRSNKNINSF